MIIRIVRALLSRTNRFARMVRRHWINMTHVGVILEPGVDVFGHVSISVTDGGFLHVKSNTIISKGVSIVVQSGRLSIGSNAFIGQGVVLVSQESIQIGDDALIAEFVVIRDQDHRTDESPIRKAGFRASPIIIENDVWIGCKATILRGVKIGEHSVIAAHSLINSDVAAGVIVAGAPARVIKKI